MTRRPIYIKKIVPLRLQVLLVPISQKIIVAAPVYVRSYFVLVLIVATQAGLSDPI